MSMHHANTSHRRNIWDDMEFDEIGIKHYTLTAYSHVSFLLLYICYFE